MPGWAIPVTSGLLAAAPDLDLAWRHVFHTEPASLLSHRALSHSPLFLILAAGVLAAFVTLGCSRRAFAWMWLVWAGCMVTHSLLDALSDGGRGIMLFLPFTTHRYFFPWRPIYNPVGSGEPLFSRAWFLRLSEIPFCLTAAAIGVYGLLAGKNAAETELRQPTAPLKSS